MTKMLSEHVEVQRRFRRSIRVGADTEASEGFICTATAAQAMRTTIDHVADHQHSAFTWTGPYGCGKSSLAVVFTAALGAPGPARDAALATMPTELRECLLKRLGWKKPGFTTISLVGRRSDAATVVSEALDEAGVASGNGPIERLLAVSKTGSGALLVIDEMGKLLEHAATEGGDAFFFQELAEAASRSEGRLIVVGILHQAFDDYAYRLARETRDDWLKIQGRYVDVPLNPTGEEQLELLARAISSSKLPAKTAGVELVAKEVSGSKGDIEAVRKRLEGCWPLGPVAACLLGPLSRRRFGQNQRSLFGFLASAEPHGFQDYLSSTPVKDATGYNCDWLWSYLRANLEPSIMASPDSHRWSLAIDAVERSEAAGADVAELSALKSIALLDMFRERSGLVASENVLQAALPELNADEISSAIAALKRRSVVIFRRHLGGYSLYAGSDFDVEEAIDEELAASPSCDFAKLRGTGVLSPVLAKREYHETGAMRWFDVDVATVDEAQDRLGKFEEGAGSSGLFLLLVDEAGEKQTKLRKRLDEICEAIGERPIAVGVSSDSYMLRELTREVVALDKVSSSRPELKGDAVARREVAGRLARTAGELEDRLRHGFSSVNWRVPALPTQEVEEDSRGRDLSVIASLLARRLYPETPRIPNELVNRTKPSSNAVAAMRALMYGMTERADEPRLGIEKSPPELGLYVSLLERTSLHKQANNGRYELTDPKEGSHGLSSLWSEADKVLRNADTKGITLEALFDLWRARPFGTKDGLLPVLGLAYVLTRRDKIAIYLDDTFCTSVGDLFVDRLLQDAKGVRLRHSEISERDAAILRNMSEVIAELSDEPVESAEPLIVGRRLVSLVMDTPGWVRRTTRLSASARKVRDLAIAAHDPNKFVLDDIPSNVGASDEPEAIASILRAGLEEIRNAYDRMLRSLEAGLLDELRASPSSGFERLRQRAETVVGITGNFRLDAFATRLTSFDSSIDVLEGLASLAANKPPRDWVDRDVDAARIELAALARDFLRAEGLAHVSGREQSRFALAIFTSDPDGPGTITPDVEIDRNGLDDARALAERLRCTITASIPRDVAFAAAVELALLLSAEREQHDENERVAAGGAM